MSSPKKRTPKKAVAAKTKPDPTKGERMAIARARENRKCRPSRAQYSESPDAKTGEMRLDAPHSDAEGHPYLVTETFATTSNDFVGASMLSLANITLRNGKPCLEGLNASLALIGAIAPENELEAALATQMAATHELAMDLLRRTKAANTRDGVREYANLATKMQRTFTAQIKALSDWRRGGEQVVRHVHVYEGGQAVVAETVNVGGRNEIGSNKPYEQGALGSAMLGFDPAGHGLPVSRDEGQEPVPTTRGRNKGRGRTTRKQEC